jgi:hypothetical protein
LKRWGEALAQARREGFKGRLKKGTPFYDRDKEIDEGKVVADNLALAEENDIARDPTELLLEEEQQKEKIAREEGTATYNFPNIPGETVSDTIVKDAVDDTEKEVVSDDEVKKEVSDKMEEEIVEGGKEKSDDTRRDRDLSSDDIKQMLGEIMSMLKGIKDRGECKCKMEEESESDYEDEDEYVYEYEGRGLVPTMAEHKLMLEMQQRAHLFQ